MTPEGAACDGAAADAYSTGRSSAVISMTNDQMLWGVNLVTTNRRAETLDEADGRG